MVRLFFLFFLISWTGSALKISGSESPNLIKRIEISIRERAKYFQGCKSFVFSANNASNLEILTSSSDFSDFGTPYALNQEPLRNGSHPPKYFHQEFNLERLLSLKAFGSFRFNHQCSIIIIFPDSGSSEIMTESLLASKLAHPTHDLFVYISDSLEIRRYFNVDLSWNIPNKFGLLKVSSGVEFELLKPCRELGEEPSGPCKRSIVSGKRFLVRGNQGAPYFRFNSDGSPGGMENDLLDIMSTHYNFTTKRTYGSGSGTRLKNGTWINVVGDILYGRADIGASIALNLQRLAAIDYTSVNVNLDRIFLIKIPPLRTSWTIFFQSFTPLVWLLIIASIMITSFVYSLSLRSPGGYEALGLNLLKAQAFEDLMKIFFEQDIINIRLGRFSTRQILTFWIYFSLILGTAYKSKLYNFLSFPSPPPLPSTHAELSSSTFQIYFKSYRGVALQILEASKEIIPFHKVIWNKMHIIYTTIECANLLFTSSSSACLDYEVNLEFIIASNTTINPFENPMKFFKKSTDKLAPPLNGIFPVRKGSPLTNIIGGTIGRLRSHYIIEILMRRDRDQSMKAGAKWLKSQKGNPVRERLEEAQREREVTARPLSLGALGGIFYIYLIGCLINGMVFFGESFYTKLKPLGERRLSLAAIHFNYL